MKVQVILGLFLVAALVSSVQSQSPVSTCANVYNCLGWILGVNPATITTMNAGQFESAVEGLTISSSSPLTLTSTLFGAQPATALCLFPACPEGWVIDPSDSSTSCKKSISGLYGVGNQSAYTSLAGCLSDVAFNRGIFGTATQGSYSFRIRNCMQPFNRAYKDCLYTLGILG